MSTTQCGFQILQEEHGLTLSERGWVDSVWKNISWWNLKGHHGLTVSQRVWTESAWKSMDWKVCERTFGIALVEWISQSDTAAKRIGWHSFGWILGHKWDEVWVRLYKTLHNWHCFHINVSCITFV